MEEKFYLQDSRQYVGNDMLFWRKGCSGYTTNLDDAHEFTLQEALSERRTDIPWSVDQMRKLSRPAVDMQRLPYTTTEQYKKMKALAEKAQQSTHTISTKEEYHDGTS